jgi:hypothetical protein
LVQVMGHLVVYGLKAKDAAISIAPLRPVTLSGANQVRAAGLPSTS